MYLIHSKGVPAIPSSLLVVIFRKHLVPVARPRPVNSTNSRVATLAMALPVVKEQVCI